MNSTAPPIECVFFDCDDCLYKNDWKTAVLLSSSIENYCVNVLHLPRGKAYELYKTYGTAIKGLVEEKLVAEDQVDAFLQRVHDVPLDDIQPDPQLREMLLAIPYPRWVFTASIREHAQRCLERLGIGDLFLGIISASSRDMIDQIGYVTKHDPRCFQEAMRVASVSPDRADRCVFFDDSVTNLKAAKKTGWRTILVGLHARDSGALLECPEADLKIDTIHEVRDKMPELFKQEK